MDDGTDVLAATEVGVGEEEECCDAACDAAVVAPSFSFFNLANMVSYPLSTIDSLPSFRSLVLAPDAIARHNVRETCPYISRFMTILYPNRAHLSFIFYFVNERSLENHLSKDVKDITR